MEFNSILHQTNGKIDANQLFEDIDFYMKNLRLSLPEGKRINRKHPLQHILNATSGGYVSPTAMKSFELCPAGYLYAKLVPEKTGTATSIGTSYHTIMERWHNLSGECRTKENLYTIMNEVVKEDQQEQSLQQIQQYVDGYCESGDYLSKGNEKHMDWKNLVCFNEVFIKPTINPLGVNLNVPIYLLVDRIDIREDGICVIDYKTGMGDPNPYLLGEHGYLPQMIFYKWGVEAEYGQEIKSAYLCLPGAYSRENKYVEMNVNSLVEQSKVVEQVKFHLDHIHSVKESKIFEESLMRYCNSCPMKTSCTTFIKEKNLDSNLALQEIPVHMDIDDAKFIEDEK